MMSNLLSLNFFLSLIFIFFNHPLSMGLILLIQTIIISMITGNLNYNFWYSYMLFLILIGGMLILFLYMTSIASNEKFKFNFKILSLLIFPSFMMITYNSMYSLNMKMLNNETLKFYYNLENHNFINKFINSPSTLLLMFMMIYLFITLIAIVKIIDLKYGPLRQMN